MSLKALCVTLSFLLSILPGCSGENSGTPPAQESGTGFIERGGANLRYLREGSGVPAVVIGSSTYYPRAFSSTLRDDLDLIFADGRHFAPSYDPSEAELEALSLETWADDVEALRRWLGIDRWIVIGHSLHAQIALDYARKFPHAVDRLVLIAGVPYSGRDVDQALANLWDLQATERRKAQHEINVQGLEDSLEEAPAGRRFVVNYVANAALFWTNPAYDSTPLWEGVQTSQAFDKLAQSIPGRLEVKKTIDDLEMPTLVVVGKHDYAVPYAIWEALVADNPAVTYVLMQQDSHNPQTESSDRFDPILLDWLEIRRRLVPGE